MFKKLISAALTIALVAAALPGAIVPVRHAEAADEWTDIDTPAKLYDIRNDLDGSYRLTADIDLSVYSAGNGWAPIGDLGTPFRGKFDGNGYTIRNLKIDSTANSVGLFGETDGPASLTNVRLTNVDVKGTSDVGALVGYLGMGGEIAGSSVQGTVSGSERVGMLVGYLGLSTVRESYAKGQLQAIPASNDPSFGGLIGYATSNGTKGIVADSYSAALVSGAPNGGGLIGEATPGLSVTNSFWDVEASGKSNSARGTGKTTAEMKSKGTFDPYWNLQATWGMIEKSTYPMLRAEYERVALASLAAEDAADSSPVTLDRAFAPDYGEYAAYVPYKTDEINVVTAISGPSSVSVNGGGPVATIALAPGPNVIPIVVQASADLGATYKLTVYRDAGTPAYPHRISTAAQLAKIGDAAEGYDWDDAYKLEADIDLSGYGAGAGWMPIGTEFEAFEGVFDGDGHTIANLKIDRPDTDSLGLFRIIANAEIRNLALTDVDITGKNQVGGVAGTAIDSDVTKVAANGSVEGASNVGGLIGLLMGSASGVEQSYAAVRVAGGSLLGGLIGSNGDAGNVVASFWDTQLSGQSASAGGTGKTTAEMLTKATYTDEGWTFGGGSWGMIEGTAYPMPYASFVRASLSGLTVNAAGTTVSMNRTFDAAYGEYVATLGAPVPQASIGATAATGGATVAFAGAAADGTVSLGLGGNPVEIRVTGPGGAAQGLYKLNIVVPTPQANTVIAPTDGAYGIGRQLKFTVSYSHPVDVTGTPVLPLTIGGETVNATYLGKAIGFPNRLEFVYTVQAGDQDADGVSLDTAIIADAPAAIAAIGEDVPLTLPALLPDLSGVVVDGLAPTIGLTPAPTAPTSDPVTVTIAADGTGSGIVALKWAAGTHPASYFAGAGTAVVGGTFQADDNGAYTVYAVDEAGNETVETIAIGNIVSDLPSISLGHSPAGVTNAGVDVAVTATANNEAGGNALTSLKWAAGVHAASAFAADPSLGADVPASGSFHVAANGTYTVYAADTIGNGKVETITIGNIVTQPPAIALDYNPKASGQARVEISVTVSVYGAGIGNTLADLRWAEGARGVGDFADPAFGADVPSAGTFSVGKNAAYTVFAADAAGNVRAETIDISNISAPSTWVPTPDPTPDPDRKQFYLVPGQAYKLELDGMTLTVPNGAIAEPMTITIKRATMDAESRLSAGQKLLADAFELTKSVPGKFAVPLRLEVRLKGDAGAKPSLYYYDETSERWTSLPSKTEGNAVAGETDHFTLFAVLPAQAELSDIAGHWAERDIRDGVARGWVDGYPDGTFAPDRTVTRAEFAVMLGRALGWTNGSALAFADAATIPDWATEAIAGAVQAGVINGYPDGSFRPDRGIGRVEAAVMIAKAAGLTPAGGGRTAFADDGEIPEWAKPLIEAGRADNLLRGSGGNKFVPSALTTRAEAVVLLKRLEAYRQRND